MTLSDFPVDDTALDRLEHAIGTCLGGEDSKQLVGGEYTLNMLLDFYSGFDPSKFEHLGTGPDPLGQGWEVEWVRYPDPIYSATDVISSLIKEVRRLRGKDTGPSDGTEELLGS